MKARRLPIIGTDVDWILRIDEGSTTDTLVAVVSRGEKTERYPYNEHFEFPK